jgi:hypothetical protein
MFAITLSVAGLAIVDEAQRLARQANTARRIRSVLVFVGCAAVYLRDQADFAGAMLDREKNW